MDRDEFLHRIARILLDLQIQELKPIDSNDIPF